MTCTRCHDRDDSGPACSCGWAAANTYYGDLDDLARYRMEMDAARDNVLMDAIDGLTTPHSDMTAAQAIAEARFMGEASHGDGWRRLLWRMATLLEESR